MSCPCPCDPSRSTRWSRPFATTLATDGSFAVKSAGKPAACRDECRDESKSPKPESQQPSQRSFRRRSCSMDLRQKAEDSDQIRAPRVRSERSFADRTIMPRPHTDLGSSACRPYAPQGVTRATRASDANLGLSACQQYAQRFTATRDNRRQFWHARVSTRCSIARSVTSSLHAARGSSVSDARCCSMVAISVRTRSRSTSERSDLPCHIKQYFRGKRTALDTAHLAGTILLAGDNAIDNRHRDAGTSVRGQGGPAAGGGYAITTACAACGAERGGDLTSRQCLPPERASRGTPRTRGSCATPREHEAHALLCEMLGVGA
jgi:hypothetical protein